MKRPPPDDVASAAAIELMRKLSSALRAERLVGLLEGNDRTELKIVDMLPPEIPKRPEPVRNVHLFPVSDPGPRRSRPMGDEGDPRNDGKVLDYPSKRGPRP